MDASGQAGSRLADASQEDGQKTKGSSLSLTTSDQNPTEAGSRLADVSQKDDLGQGPVEKWPIPQSRDEAERMFREMASAPHDKLYDFLERFEKAVANVQVKREVIQAPPLLK